jgi:hypothetical protein
MTFNPTNWSNEEGIEVAKRLTDKSNALPLDEFIESLRKRTKRPSLCFAGDPLPFARQAVLNAFIEASFATRTRAVYEWRTTHLKSQLKLLKKIERQLENVIRSVDQMKELEDALAELTPSPSRALKDLSSAVLEIKNIAQLGRKDFTQRDHRVGDLWRTTFVSELFDAWRRLTGGSPFGEHFTGFATAAWRSLSVDQPDVPFQRTIRTAHHRLISRVARTKGTLAKSTKRSTGEVGRI